MKTTLFTRLMTAAFITSILAIACKKETSHSEEPTPQQEQEIAMAATQTEAETDLVDDDLFNNVVGVDAEVGLGGVGIFGRAAATDIITGRTERTDTIRCFTVTKTRLNAPALFPVKVIIDFGNGCTGRDGRTRYGKIITIYTGPLFVPGSSATTTFESHRIDSISIEGTHKIENTTPVSTNNQTQFTIDVMDGKLSKPNGNFSRWSSHKVRTRIEGNGTLLPVDDVFKITGHAQGQVKHGNILFGWRSEIMEPLYRKFLCRWVQKGVVKTWRENLLSTSPWIALLNYGTGACDNQATLIINGNTHQITLR